MKLVLKSKLGDQGIRVKSLPNVISGLLMAQNLKRMLSKFAG